ncbi:MAG: CBS domain-containing protein [Planctomycetes bacterium]|nr:CBS domain-containing protein [Planctomycetota bacterium]
MKNIRSLRARDVMKSPVISTGFETPVREVADLLTSHKISGALVTGRNGEPVGVVSLFDLVSFLAGLERPAGAPGGFYQYVYPDFEGDGQMWEVEIQQVEEKPLAETPVGDIMATTIIAVRPEAPLAEVAALMARNRIHRVFVGESDGPAGVLSSMDVLRALSREAKSASMHRRPVAKPRRKTRRRAAVVPRR